MNNYSLVLNSVLEKMKSGKTVDDIVDNIIQSINKEFGNEVDFSFLYEKLNEFNAVIDTAFTLTQKKRFYIPEEDKWVSLTISTATLKTINKKGISPVLKEAREKGHYKG